MWARRRGFTLVELLVVIAIIAILAAILFPVFLRAKAAAAKASCASNMREIDYAYKMYLADYGDFYPSNDFRANLFLVDPYMRGQHRFKPDDTGRGTEQTVWLCRAAAGSMGLWYRVQSNYWDEFHMTPPWNLLGIKGDWCRVYNSYVVNDDVTSIYLRTTGWTPAPLAKVAHRSKIVFFAEGCYNPNRQDDGLSLGTAPTATHPSRHPREVTSGWFPGYPSSNPSDVEIRHNSGSNFLFVDSQDVVHYPPKPLVEILDLRDIGAPPLVSGKICPEQRGGGKEGAAAAKEKRRVGNHYVREHKHGPTVLGNGIILKLVQAE